MSSRIEVVNLIENVNLSGLSGPNPYDTPTLDLRVFAPRIEAVVARGRSPGVSQPDYAVFWYGGVTTTEIMGDATGMTGGDRFEPVNTNAAVIDTNPSGTHPEGSENWLIAPMPTVLWPFVRFRLISAAGSPGDSVFDLYAVIRRRFD